MNRLITDIAVGYVNAKDDLDTIPSDKRIMLRKIVNEMFSEISRDIHFDFVIEDPYEYVNIEELMPDFRKGIIKVNCSGNNSELWGPVYNLMFRAVHDYVHCIGKLDFNFVDELIALSQQLELTKSILGHKAVDMHGYDWDLYHRVLRSEIAYQAAYKTYSGEFHVPQQKIILQLL